MHNIYAAFHLRTGEQIFQLHIPFYNMLHIFNINNAFYKTAFLDFPLLGKNYITIVL